jgi:hypothetical protein
MYVLIFGTDGEKMNYKNELMSAKKKFYILTNQDESKRPKKNLKKL